MKKLILTFLVVMVLGLTGAFFLVRMFNGRSLPGALYKPDVQVVVLEGWRKEQLAAKLQALGICSASDFLTASSEKEGYLFPDTYRFFANTPASEVVNTLTNNFTKKVGALHPTDDQVILASIVEREAKNDTDRPLIAGVYSNRLKIDMTLGADPTVQYSKDSLAFVAAGSPQNFDFWKPITVADYQNVKSAFNTYLQIGLPPHAISNPGKKSIEAAINPAKHMYYYFLYRDDTLMMSKTLDEHTRK